MRGPGGDGSTTAGRFARGAGTILISAVLLSSALVLGVYGDSGRAGPALSSGSGGGSAGPIFATAGALGPRAIDVGENPSTDPGPSSAAWFNQTTMMDGSGAGPPASRDGGLAYDPLLDELLLFGGCARVCPENFTWVYDGFDWTNLTGTLARAPPALEGLSMAWDPQRDGVLLTGGALANDTASNQTWLFAASGWTNLTASVNNASAALYASPLEAYGSMAYDGALHRMVEVNGCYLDNYSCNATAFGQTFELGGPGSVWTDVASFAGALFPGNSTIGGFNASMAYDPLLGELVYFGGENGTDVPENFTWVMNSTGWYNITSTAAGCDGPVCYAPTASASAGMTWDGQLGEIVLVGGTNATGASTDLTSVFSQGHWAAACSGGCPAPGPFAGGELASNSTDVAPLVVGGACGAPACAGTSWVFETPAAPSFSEVTPNPGSVGVAVTVAVDAGTSHGSGPFVFDTIGDNVSERYATESTGVNFSSVVAFGTTFTYATAGTYSLFADVEDFFYVVGWATPVALVINGSLSAAPLATPATTELGSPVSFAAGVSGGVPPYSYTWGFGDLSPTSSAPAPSHVYAAAGRYAGYVVVTDGIGATVNASFVVTVDPPLTVDISANVTTTDVGAAVQYQAFASGGSDTYAEYAWSFGEHLWSNASDAAPQVVYPTAGTVTVDLNVTDSLGFTAEATATIVVNPQLSGLRILAGSTSVAPGASDAFTVVFVGGTPGYTYLWSFGDGTTANSAAPTHTFSAAGTYVVRVGVQDRVGDRATANLTVTVRTASPAASPVSPLTWAAIASAIVVAAAIAVVLVRRRRRPPAPTRALNTGEGRSDAGGRTAPAPLGDDGAPPGQ